MIVGKGTRAARRALAIAGMMVAASAGAASAPELRIGAVPAWVQPVALASLPPALPTGANVAYGVRYDLIDDQVRLAAGTRERWHHVVSEAVTDKGIDDLSHREIDFAPAWEKITLVQLDVVRDGRRVSRLRDVQVKVLQRERDLDSRIYDGRKQVALDLPDIRVGDIVEFAYERSGMNPVFQGHHAGDFDMQWQIPVAQVHRRLSVATGLGLHVAQLTGAAAPVLTQAGGFDERTWDARDVPALHLEAGVPASFNPFPWVEWSDFATWGDVARWAEPLYRVPPTLSPALRAVVDQVAQASPAPEARVAAVLRLVQQQVRYLGVEIGEGTHAPSAPDVVYARRWGDCKEKALLMVTLLRALGIEASPALVNTQRQADIARDLPSSGSFDHVITRVRVGGREFWLDPTRPPQQGTLAAISQPDYARALVLDGRATALAAMPAHAPSARGREVQVDVDSRAGFDQPVRVDVRTTYRGFSADAMRDEIGDGDRAELQRRYLNFYAGPYPHIAVAAPFEVADDPLANTVVVTEHYQVAGFWAADKDGARQAWFHAPEVDNELKAPDEPVRTMPLALHGPQSVREQVRVRLPQAWPTRSASNAVHDAAFSLAKHVRVEGDMLTSDYALEITQDQVAGNAVAGYAADVAKARAMLGDSLSTAHEEGVAAFARRYAWIALALLAVAAAMFARWRWNRRARAPQPQAPLPMATEDAANDSRQPLAA